MDAISNVCFLLNLLGVEKKDEDKKEYKGNMDVIVFFVLNLLQGIEKKDEEKE